jgi:hypothetical protein
MSIAEMIPELATKQTQGERTSLNLLWKSLQHRRYLPYLVFGLCASFYFLPFMLLLLRGFNEGTLDCGAVRILHGQLLGRDFFEVIGPGTFYWLALFFKLFGVTFLASRICLFVGSLLTVLSMYFLARRVCHRYQILPCILLFATYFDTHWPEVNYHIDSNCFALLAVVCMVLWQGSRKNWLLVTAGHHPHASTQRDTAAACISDLVVDTALAAFSLADCLDLGDGRMGCRCRINARLLLEPARTP